MNKTYIQPYNGKLPRYDFTKYLKKRNITIIERIDNWDNLVNKILKEIAKGEHK